MVEAVLQRVRIARFVRLLSALEPRQRFYSPALTPQRLCVEVTPEGEVIVAQVYNPGREGSPPVEDPQDWRLRIARVSGPDLPTSLDLPWQELADKLAAPGFPTLARTEAGLEVGFQAHPDGPDAAYQGAPAALYGMSIRGGEVAGPVALLGRAAFRVAMAPAPAGGSLLVFRPWVDRRVDPAARRLFLAHVDAAGSLQFAVPLPGTERRGSSPVDYAVAVDAEGRIHTTYDAPSEDGKGERVLHAVHDPEGELLEGPRDLGPAARYPLLSRIVSDARGGLQLFQVHRPFKHEPRTEHRLVSLEARAPRGAPARHFLVDYFLDLHVLTFDSEGDVEYAKE